MKTMWTDRMILETIKSAQALTPAAIDRAFELADIGYIDMTGTWKLTESGAKLVS